ncbi:cupin domain-containing protein [Mucilaginibacter pedocola]|uniref:Cupin type-2 domain-containing protein n=1 Tax=Mucilaginibacter pedocola TaxID=1792845 RepID=A0A1S9PKE2_9SPHI|nr:cupin domain-containing protein [Mucilaginibacter pedocola]OOQ61433.1 hypothetical protein BC343_20930 [Mucilaginibacter pedocola]
MENIQTENQAAVVPTFRSYYGGYFEILISPEESAGNLGMVDMRLPKGSEPPPHIHLHEDETFYILEGEVVVTVAGKQTYLKAGQAAFGPKGLEHAFEVLTPEARIIITITPGDFVNFFKEFSAPVEGAPQITPPQGPPPAEAIEYMAARLKSRYNVMFV